MDYLEVYNGVKKCVVNDYPFELNWKDDLILAVFRQCYSDLLDEHSMIDNSYYRDIEGNGIIRIEYIDHYVILCYRFSRALYLKDMSEIADAVYYSLRVRGSIDLYYKCDIGKCFIPAHALGTALDAHAKYGDYFRIYNGCHIGPFSIVGMKPNEWEHPKFGNNVTMLANSKVYGKTVIGNNVIVSAGSMVVNEIIPDNCIVSGTSPNLFFKKNIT